MDSTKKIIDYTIVQDRDPSGEVTELIKRGWQPYGFLIVVSHANSNHNWLIQAMVKYKDE